MATVSKCLRRLRRYVFRESQLDMLIPPEIVNDRFSEVIRQYAAEPDVRLVLEIGSSSGDGSTAALVSALAPKDVKDLYCIELSKPRFAELVARYSDLTWVHCYNLPSVPLEAMPTIADVAKFYKENPSSPLRRSKLTEVQRWLRQDLEYLQRNTWPLTGIDAARRDAKVSSFDLVLIDGSEFTGEVEWTKLYGASYVLLDDTLTYKNLSNLRRLSADPNYRLLIEDRSCRNGFAVFKRV